MHRNQISGALVYVCNSLQVLLCAAGYSRLLALFDLICYQSLIIWIASCTKSHSFYNTSTIFFREVRPETILTRSWLTPKCAASFFNSSLLALPRSGCDLIDMTIWSPMTSSCPSELNLTETEYCTCSSWKRVLENLLLARSK